MRKLFVIALALCLMVSIGYATTRDTKVSGSTVSFSSVNLTVNRPANTVTFNSVTNKIILTNLSVVADCYVDIIGKLGSRNSATVLVPALGRATPNTVTLDFATRNLAFTADTSDTGTAPSTSNQQIRYIVTGDVGDL